VERARFWEMPERHDQIGLDGFDWTIEGRNHDGYHLSECWSPRRRPFCKLGMLLVEFSGFGSRIVCRDALYVNHGAPETHMTLQSLPAPGRCTRISRPGDTFSSTRDAEHLEIAGPGRAIADERRQPPQAPVVGKPPAVTSTR
jgi:hypothetical protein